MQLVNPQASLFCNIFHVSVDGVNFFTSVLRVEWFVMFFPIMEAMIAKRPDELKNTGSLYLRPLPQPKGAVWYTKQPVGVKESWS